jgi:hypothetical protein
MNRGRGQRTEGDPVKGLSDVVVHEWRRNATQGASVPELLRLLVGQLGTEADYRTTLARYFMAAFDLPLAAVSPLGGWAPDSRGEVSDARIQELIYPEMIRRREKWLVSEREQV